MIDRDKIIKESVAYHKNDQLTEAETGYRKILEFHPSDADALYLLGTACYQRQQFDLAYDLLKKALAIRNDVPVYHNNLGLVFYKQRKIDEAIKCYRHALKLDAKFSLAHYNLGYLSQDQENMDEAIRYYEKALINNPLYTEALTDLINLLSCLGADDAALAHLKAAKSVHQSEDYYRELVITSNTMIILWKRKNILACAELAKTNAALKDVKTTTRNKSYQAYVIYVSKLVRHYTAHETCFAQEEGREPLYVFGDSHSLTYSNLIMGDLVGKSELIMGLKMWHLSDPRRNFFRACLKQRLKKLPKNSHLLFAIGDLDCRPEGGIWKVFKKGQRPLSDIIETTVAGYVTWLGNNIKGRNPASVTISGVPAPAYPWENDGFTAMIGQVNHALHEAVKAKGWRFLDVYSLTANENGVSNGKWNLDGFHVQPRLCHEIWPITP